MGIDTTLPGDMGVFDTEGLGEGEPIWDRMASSSTNAAWTCAT